MMAHLMEGGSGCYYNWDGLLIYLFLACLFFMDIGWVPTVCLI